MHSRTARTTIAADGHSGHLLIKWNSVDRGEQEGARTSGQGRGLG